jgi:small nuclear ribonucleoprotein (snRNP)-like protein
VGVSVLLQHGTCVKGELAAFDVHLKLALDADPHLHTPPVARQHSELLNIAEDTQCLVVMRVQSCLGSVCLGVSCTR